MPNTGLEPCVAAHTDSFRTSRLYILPMRNQNYQQHLSDTAAGAITPTAAVTPGRNHAHQVNLKAELEIMLLHDKLDLLRQDQWVQLLEIQREQLKLLGDLMKKTSAAR